MVNTGSEFVGHECSIQDLNLRDMNVSDGYMNDRLLDETSRVW